MRRFLTNIWIAICANPKTTIPALIAQIAIILGWFHVGFDITTQQTVGGELIVLIGILARDGDAPKLQ